MNTATAINFEVSAVQRATTPLPDVPYRRAVEGQLNPNAWEQILSLYVRKKVAAAELPEPRRWDGIEACSRDQGRLLGRVSYHPVVAALHMAFMDHRPVCLSPDMIWLMICQAVANHVNAHAEQLRPRFVQHPGKLLLEVERNDLVKGSPENPWPQVFTEFSMRIREHIGPTIHLFLPAFSTTGPVERSACEVVLLDAMQSYFSYSLSTVCGIPAMTLEGTAEDWTILADRVQAFAEFDLNQWVSTLLPILFQFVDAASGQIDRSFWQSIYRFQSGSGGSEVTGWITKFFPYLPDEESGRASRLNRSLFGHYGSGRLDALPSGLAKAPFEWQFYGDIHHMEFLGGFVGVAQDSTSLSLRPEIGWAVRESPRVGESSRAEGFQGWDSIQHSWTQPNTFVEDHADALEATKPVKKRPDRELIALLRGGNKIEAIQVYQESMGVGAEEAKEAVVALEVRMHQEAGRIEEIRRRRTKGA
jgi:hypothetical protein